MLVLIGCCCCFCFFYLFSSFVIATATACDCHPLGSIRDDCEQMTGRCVCRDDVVGLKCDRCEDGRLIDAVPEGCGSGTAGGGGRGFAAGGAAGGGGGGYELRHCSDLTCRYGAICQDMQGQAVCVCPMDCPSLSSQDAVCGSDGVSYGSECDLRLAACRQQLDVSLAYEGPCSDDDDAGVPAPAPADAAAAAAADASAFSKATRHVQVFHLVSSISIKTHTPKAY